MVIVVYLDGWPVSRCSHSNERAPSFAVRRRFAPSFWLIPGEVGLFYQRGHTSVSLEVLPGALSRLMALSADRRAL